MNQDAEKRSAWQTEGCLLDMQWAVTEDNSKLGTEMDGRKNRVNRLKACRHSTGSSSSSVAR
jgi:hypothetical protein